VIHVRIVSPPDRTEAVLAVLAGSPAVVNVIHLPGAARKPDGDVVQCDVAREDASLIVGELRALGIARDGSIALDPIDTSISAASERAERAAAGLPSDAVVWERVESVVGESTELSWSFLAFMVIATLLASIAILLDSPVLLVGGMVVGPEFGPIAAIAVALVQRRGALARRSSIALVVGFVVAVVAAYVGTELLDAFGIISDGHTNAVRPFTGFISKPDALSFLVAYLAGTAGILSLTTSKSAALIGVLISVTTIPAAANMAVAAAESAWAECGEAAAQLGLNLVALLLACAAAGCVRRSRPAPARRAPPHRHGLSCRAAAGRGVRSRDASCA
jgi:uncharacterized hydrophobic protein (TIGR00271 family)